MSDAEIGVSDDDVLRVDVVGSAAAGELLTVRRAAFVTEAQRYGDPHLPPLTETMEELLADLARPDVVTLGAWQGHRLVGSVRVDLESDRATLGRLAVVPDLQGLGIGTQLLLAVLRYLPEQTQEVWVSTGRDRTQSLPIAGASSGGADGGQFDEHTGDLTYAYLRKILGEAELGGQIP